jgi:hypothetical protein
MVPARFYQAGGKQVQRIPILKPFCERNYATFIVEAREILEQKKSSSLELRQAITFSKKHPPVLLNGDQALEIFHYMKLLKKYNSNEFVEEKNISFFIGHLTRGSPILDTTDQRHPNSQKYLVKMNINQKGEAESNNVVLYEIPKIISFWDAAKYIRREPPHDTAYTKILADLVITNLKNKYEALLKEQQQAKDKP